MVLTKVSGDLISIISETGETSSFAATLGRRFYSNKQKSMHMIYLGEEKWAMAHKLTKMVYLKNRNHFE